VSSATGAPTNSLPDYNLTTPCVRSSPIDPALLVQPRLGLLGRTRPVSQVTGARVADRTNQLATSSLTSEATAWQEFMVLLLMFKLSLTTNLRGSHRGKSADRGFYSRRFGAVAERRWRRAFAASSLGARGTQNLLDLRGSELMFAAGDVSQIVTRLRSSRSARQVRELRSSLSALGRCRREGLQSTLVVPVLDGTLVVPVLDSTAMGRARYGDCDQSSIGLTTPAGRRCRRSFLCTVCG
jgi:hypothetical protein